MNLTFLRTQTNNLIDSANDVRPEPAAIVTANFGLCWTSSHFYLTNDHLSSASNHSIIAWYSAVLAAGERKSVTLVLYTEDERLFGLEPSNNNNNDVGGRMLYTASSYANGQPGSSPQEDMRSSYTQWLDGSIYYLLPAQPSQAQPASQPLMDMALHVVEKVETKFLLLLHVFCRQDDDS
ncbi:hypothetical protein DAPPUDRAFT_255575 [Daphnia pulex]|uniref:Uncharacterized protein n=1 Tax=Daphnia pulex TaxID=6669 RepID=E9H9I8_DAPPU|nr:hypothetical protein DAPPUDRAFT_255575 [Daphnia pulex]|eukprot:EFX71624.1 hypothetical protein DAPPUDRAFT_255575 [Daphnia pulex]